MYKTVIIHKHNKKVYLGCGGQGRGGGGGGDNRGAARPCVVN